MSAVSPGWRLLLHGLRRLPQGALSRGWGRFADLTLPGPLQRALNEGFARVVGIDRGESEGAPSEYASLSAFFARRLRDGVRSWPEDPEMPGSPADGILGTYGRIRGDTVLQAKGVSYRVADLLGEDAGGLEDGLYFTIYLSPRHYHRIHAPVSGVISEARAIPGRLLPVNRAAITAVPDLFPRNERLVARLETGATSAALVAIGAYNVGRISAAFDPDWCAPAGTGVTNRRDRTRPELRRYDPPLPVGRGDEMMAFHFGSTIVLFLGPGGQPSAAPNPALVEGGEIRLGTALLDRTL